MVGYPSCLGASAQCGYLISMSVRMGHTVPESVYCDIWYFSVDVDGVHNTSLHFSHPNNELLGKHHALHSSWYPSQPPNGWLSACFPSCCISCCTWTRLASISGSCNFFNCSCSLWSLLDRICDVRNHLLRFAPCNHQKRFRQA